MAADGRDDDVDLLIDAWSQRLPDVDLTPLDIGSRLRRVSIRLGKIRAGAFATAGLAPWEFDVLAALRRADPPHELSPGQLVERTMIGSAAMTNRVDRLIQRDLVERESHPRDGRSVIVRLRSSGADRVDAAMLELVRRERLMLSVLSDDDVAALARMLRPLMNG